jgi:hypothetical protein
MLVVFSGMSGDRVIPLGIKYTCFCIKKCTIGGQTKKHGQNVNINDDFYAREMPPSLPDMNHLHFSRILRMTGMKTGWDNLFLQLS